MAAGVGLDWSLVLLDELLAGFPRQLVGFPGCWLAPPPGCWPRCTDFSRLGRPARAPPPGLLPVKHTVELEEDTRACRHSHFWSSRRGTYRTDLMAPSAAPWPRELTVDSEEPSACQLPAGVTPNIRVRRETS
ncbi:hypothetical protein AB0K93_30500 [Streptomyces sp. NPDC052676]|uniref:hypothetical protein n=1 Tax=Streptomyces sp. NPDC052676 TaxID=3154953 RepID=UPI003424F258